MVFHPYASSGRVSLNVARNANQDYSMRIRESTPSLKNLGHTQNCSESNIECQQERFDEKPTYRFNIDFHFSNGRQDRSLQLNSLLQDAHHVARLIRQ